MFYLIAADIVVFLHLLWIVFLIFGAFWGRRYRRVKRVHVIGMSFALFIQVLDWYCPLTYLEVRLRRMHDPSQSYGGSFISHYVEQFVYVGLSPNAILILTILIALISAWLYLHRPAGSKGGNKS